MTQPQDHSPGSSSRFSLEKFRRLRGFNAPKPLVVEYDPDDKWAVRRETLINKVEKFQNAMVQRFSAPSITRSMDHPLGSLGQLGGNILMSMVPRQTIRRMTRSLSRSRQDTKIVQDSGVQTDRHLLDDLIEQLAAQKIASASPVPLDLYMPTDNFEIVQSIEESVHADEKVLEPSTKTIYDKDEQLATTNSPTASVVKSNILQRAEDSEATQKRVSKPTTITKKSVKDEKPALPNVESTPADKIKSLPSANKSVGPTKKAHETETQPKNAKSNEKEEQVTSGNAKSKPRKQRVSVKVAEIETIIEIDHD